MNEYEPLQPELKSGDEAIVRDIASIEGTSFAAAQKKWEMIKDAVNQQILEEEEK